MVRTPIPARRVDIWTNAFNLDNCINNISGKPVRSKVVDCGLGLPTRAHVPPASRSELAKHPGELYVQHLPAAHQRNVHGQSRKTSSASRTAVTRKLRTRRSSSTTRSQEDLAAYDAANFYAFGRTSPGYPIAPPTSINYDISWEHHFKGTEMSFKLTPFLRQTQNQIQNFFLDQKTGFVSGLNAGDQRSQGVEFQFQDGDFSRNGFAGQLSFAYTNSYIHYGSLPSGLYGTTVIGGTNQAISALQRLYRRRARRAARGSARSAPTTFRSAALRRTEPGYSRCGAVLHNRRRRRSTTVRRPTSATRTGTTRSR